MPIADRDMKRRQAVEVAGREVLPQHEASNQGQGVRVPAFDQADLNPGVSGDTPEFKSTPR